MPIDLQQLGAKCRRLRVEILSMGLEEASDRTGIDIDRLDSIENGKMEPSGDEILILADVYDEPVSFFITNERSASIEKASDLYRMYGDTFSPEDRQGIQEFLKLCRTEHEIESLLGSRPRVFNFHSGPSHWHMKTHGQQVAEKIRADMKLGDRPIDNPFHLARTLGCHVFRRRLFNSDVSGVMLHHDEFGPCILVNFEEDLFRQNFSVAHELCHALLDKDSLVTVSFNQSGYEKHDDRQKREWRANSFASHLLFPHGVRMKIALGSSETEYIPFIRRAAETYHVNPEVILYALQEASRLSEQQVEALKPSVKLTKNEKEDADFMGETSKVKWRRKRHLEKGLSSDYIRTCLRAFSEGQISYGKLANALLVSPVDLPEMITDLGHDKMLLEGGRL